MNKRSAFTALVAVLTVLLLTATAFAHIVFFACWDNGDGTISCEGGYTDGSSAAGATINVTDADGSLLFSGKLDKSGELKFNKPAGDFAVTLDGGSGHSVTIKGKDIK
ncbi:MAG: hypothetical protein N2491_12225 [Negativicutes bacterium]|nr:hypothetical protein [Negativicutes bacterium]